jgi:hypothetical protein
MQRRRGRHLEPAEELPAEDGLGEHVERVAVLAGGHQREQEGVAELAHLRRDRASTNKCSPKIALNRRTLYRK